MVKKEKQKNVYSSKTKKKGLGEEGFLTKHLHHLYLGGVVLITFIIYFPALRNQFTNWDDSVYITNNPFIKSLSVANLTYIFSNSVAANYHPLTIISLAINYKLAGTAPFSYYFVNIFFHLFNILLVFWLIMLVSGKNSAMALFTAALFAVHPMHVESVAWISERKDVLYAFFFLGGLIAYLYYLNKKSWAFHFLCVFLFLLSALSKPTAVVFPVILFIIDFYRRRKIDFTLFAEKIPFFAISIWIGIQTIYSQTEMVAADLGNFNVIQKLLFASYGFCVYILKLIVPIGLSAFYPFPHLDQTQGLPIVFWIVPFINIVFIAAVLYSLRYTRIIAFGVLFYFIAVALTLQFVQVGQAIIADRYTYLSYIGLLVALFWIVDRLLKKKRLLSVNYSYLIFLMFFIINVYITSQRIQVWKNSETLWSDVIEKFPNAAIAYSNRGLYFYDNEQYPQALADYTKALEVNPKYADAYYNRGILYLKINDPQKSIADFNESIVLNPFYSLSFRHRADAFFNLGKFDLAIMDYNKAIQINPNLPEPYCNRGNLYMQSGQFEKAVLDFKNAIDRRSNDAEYWFNLGIVYGRMGKYTESINSLTKALEYKHDYYDALTNRAIAKASLGKGDEALNDLADAISINPENESAYFSRALYFLNTGNKDQACRDLQKAMKYGNSEAKVIYHKVCENK